MSKLFIFVIYKITNIMSNNTRFDLSGVFQVQKNYLTDLSNSYPDVNNAPLVVKYVLDLQNKTKDIDASYEAANTSASAVLTQQNEMIDIVNKEKKRLVESKKLIDQAETSEERKILLTNSNRLLYEEYTKIILCVVAGLVIHIALRFGIKMLTEPISENMNTLYVLLHIVNIIVWLIVIMRIYANIQSRNQINFDEIDLPPPDLTGTSAYISPASANYNNLFKDLNICYSENCCGDGTTWDDKLGMCVKNTVDGFTDVNDSSSSSSCGCDKESPSSSQLTNESNTPITLSFSNIEQVYKNDKIPSGQTVMDLDKNKNNNTIQYTGMSFNETTYAEYNK